MAADPTRLRGTWALVAWYNQDADGQRHYPLGETASGLISYTGDGYVFVSLSAAGRRPFAVNDPFGGTPAENTAAMMSHITYSGRYDFDGADVVHRVDHASCPNWIASEQRRRVRFGPDDTLTLSAAGALFNGRMVTAHVHWRRADGGDTT